MKYKDYNANRENHPALRWLPYLFYLIITLILAIPILKNFGNWGIRDWDLFTTLNAAAVDAIATYGQFPFWNPYIGGGNILFAHPEVQVLNPLFLIQLLLGPLAGLKIQIVVMYFLGMAGFYKLSRQLGISYGSSFLPPVVYMLSSYLALHFAAGHIPFHYFAVFPWLMFFYKKSLDKPIHILSAGAAVAFIILGSGAAVPFVFCGFFLFLFSLFDIGEKHKFRPPFYVAFAFICGILFAAVKFFPMVDYIYRHPWIPENIMVIEIPFGALLDIFFNFNQSMFAEHLGGGDVFVWGWHEYGTYLGPAAAILAVIGLISGFKKRWPYLLLAVIGIALALGSFIHPYSPWDLLQKLPGFQSMRVPSRFSLLALISVAILSGYGLDYLLSKLRYRKGALAVVTLLIVLGTHLYVCLPVLGEAFVRSPVEVTKASDFRQIEGDPNRMYEAFLSNRGTIRAAWLSAYRHGRGIMGYDGQTLEWYSDNDAVKVLKREFTPNRLRFEVETETGGTLVISQGYDPGWQVEDGRSITPQSDLISFNVLPVDKKIELYYSPDFFALGLIVSILSIIAALGGAIYYRRSG